MLLSTAQILLITNLLVLLFIHLAVISNCITYSFVWGGRITNKKQMIRLEVVSILLTTIFLWLVIEYSGICCGIFAKDFLDYCLSVMAGLFVMSFIGSLSSKNKYEKLIFAPMSLLMVLCSIYLAVN